MVLFFTSTVLGADKPVTLYMGKDKYENEDLIKYAWPGDIWFHVDKLSSAHVYARLGTGLGSGSGESQDSKSTPDDSTSPTLGPGSDETGLKWDTLPEALLTDCAQLVKANSIEGNKKDNLTIIYTPAENLKKTGDMAVGQVSFKSDKTVKRVYVAKRENAIVNRLNKTKVEREVNHEQERVDRLKREQQVKRAEAAARRKAEEELAAQRAADKAARDYSLLDQADDDEDSEEKKTKTVQEMIDDFM